MSSPYVPIASSGSERSATIKPEATDFGTFGRFEETSVGEMPVAMKEAYDFTMKLRGLVPGPHRIWLANPELSKTVVPIGAYYQTRSTLTKPEIEIATNLVNGRWSAAYSNYEHEIIGEKAGGLPPEKVEAMIAGRPTSFDDPRQQVVYELASALIGPHMVPQGLYQRARELLGDKGIGRLRRSVSRGGSHPIAKQPSRRAGRPTT